MEKAKSNSPIPITTDDEIQDLKRRKEIIKLENEIAELEARKNYNRAARKMSNDP